MKLLQFHNPNGLLQPTILPKTGPSAKQVRQQNDFNLTAPPSIKNHSNFDFLLLLPLLADLFWPKGQAVKAHSGYGTAVVSLGLLHFCDDGNRRILLGRLLLARRLPWGVPYTDQKNSIL